MLSDEEKKAELKSLIEEYEICFKESKYEGNSEEYKSLKGTYKLLKDILNLIEKQSKEIEELKLKIGDEKTFIQLGECLGEKKVKDKIKAKIEEWDKDIKWNNADDHYYAIKMMQSLLEKE